MRAPTAGRATVAGVLLTGGASTRMGADKSLLEVDGVPMGARLGAMLAGAVTGPLLEVGPGHSGLPAVADDAPGAGPLAALATAARALTGWAGPTVVLACDLPRCSAAVVDLLARWPGDGAVLPVIGGRRQPLCARWAAADLAAAVRLAAAGKRSLRGLPGAGECARLTEDDLPTSVPPGDLADADTPEELAAAGVAVFTPTGSGRGAR
ncbi:MAG: molybdenum cofactor guanylyltransferase [Acidimicrobiales bacterium]